MKSKKVGTLLGGYKRWHRERRSSMSCTLCGQFLVSYSFLCVWWQYPTWVPNNSWALPSLWFFFLPLRASKYKARTPIKTEWHEKSNDMLIYWCEKSIWCRNIAYRKTSLFIFLKSNGIVPCSLLFETSLHILARHSVRKATVWANSRLANMNFPHLFYLQQMLCYIDVH